MGPQETEAMIEKMRSFYYARMTITATLMVAILALVIAVLGSAVPLIVAALSGGGR